MTTTRIPAEIIAALPVRQRPTLTIGQGNLLLDYDDEQGSAAIIGSVVQDGAAHYLGCMSCKQEIDEADGGMCTDCRSDLAYHEAVYP